MRMGTRPAETADDISTNVRAFVDRVLEADVTDTIAQRGRQLAAAVGEATEAAVDRAGGTWRETAPVRRDAIKSMRRASRDASRWGDRTWRAELRPLVRDLWNRRTVAIGAAGAAIPAGRELAETAAARVGLRQREQRHWGSFFIGLLIGVAGGVVVALLTAPKRGRELRDELSERAQTAAVTVTEKARESAGGWVPLFQRDAPDDGGGMPGEAGTAFAPDAGATAVAAEYEAATAEVPADTGDEMADAVVSEVEDRDQV